MVFTIIADVVFEGGGIRGIGHIGALNYMEACGWRWVRAAGSSVGALIVASVSSRLYCKGNEKDNNGDRL